MQITLDSSGFSINVPQSNPIQVNVGFLSAGLYGYLHSDGHFRFTAYAGIDIEAGPFYLRVNGSITLTDSSFEIHVSGGAGLEIAGHDIGISVEGDLFISGTELKFHVEATIKLLFIHITLGHTFTIGSISPPGAVQVPPKPILATPLGNGVLRLNIGTFAASRVNGEDITDDAETFTVAHATDQSGSSSGETVTVSALGFNVDYPNVTKILVVDAGQMNDTVQINSGVNASAELHGGVGDDTLIYSGNSSAYLDGGDGNNTLVATSGTGSTLVGGPGNDSLQGGTGPDTLMGGAGNDSLAAGSGNTTLTGGPGNDSISGGSGNDTIIWNAGDGSDTTVDGGGGNDHLVLNLAGGPDTVTFGPPASGNGFIVALPGATLNPVNIPNVDLFANGGSDTITVNDLGSSGLGTIDARLGVDTTSDTVNVNGSASNDTETLSTSGGNVLLAKTGGVSVVVEQAGTAFGGASINYNAGQGNDTTIVNSTLAGTTTTIRAGSGNDAIQIAPGTNLNSISGPIVVIGGTGTGTGTASLSLDDLDNNGAEAAFVTSGQITGLGMPAAAGVSYSGLRSVTLNLGSRADTVNVQSTAAGATTTINTGSGRGQTSSTSAARPRPTTATSTPSRARCPSSASRRATRSTSSRRTTSPAPPS